MASTAVVLRDTRGNFLQTSFDVSLAIDGNTTHNSAGWPNTSALKKAVNQQRTRVKMYDAA